MTQTNNACQPAINSFELITPQFNSSPSSSAQDVTNWCGHSVIAVKERALDVGKAVVSAVQSVFARLGDLQMSTYELACFFRKIERYLLCAVESAKSAHIAKVLINYIAFIDFVQLARDIDYFVNARWKGMHDDKGGIVSKRDGIAAIAANVMSLVADIGGALLWLEEMAFFNLSKAAAAVGNVRLFGAVPELIASVPCLRDIKTLTQAADAVGNLRVFSFLTKISPLFITLRALDLMYVFFTVDAVQKLMHAENHYQKMSEGLYLSSYVSEMALSALLMAGVTNPIGLGVAGTTCLTLALAAFLYRKTHEEILKGTA
jgi:hypothetical protein